VPAGWLQWGRSRGWRVLSGSIARRAVPSFETALALWRSGERRDALAEALIVHANSPPTATLLNLIAMIHASLGEQAAATEFLRAVTRLQPADATAFGRLADAELSAGHLAAAIDSLGRMVELDSGNGAAHRNLGVLLERAGNRSGAASCYRAALALDETDAVAHFNLGNVLLADHQPVAALACYQRATALRPDLGVAWCNAAGVLLGLKQATQALACADRALALDPAFPEAWHSRGAALKALGRPEEAIAACERALALRPGYVEAIYVRANALCITGDRAGAVAGFREALRLSPDLAMARLAATVAEIPLVPSSVEEVAAARQAFAAALDPLEADLRRRPGEDPSALIGAMQPFYLAYQEEDATEPLRAHGRLCVSLMEAWQRSEPLPLPAARTADRSRLRIGIVSAHIASHSVYSAITRGWLLRLDPERFAAEVFHLGSQIDADTATARGLAERFEERPRAMRDWARTLLERRLDVLVYPEIGMDQTTLQLASMRLAPTQLVSWGHPITSGLPTMDYYLSGDAFEPADASRHYTERLVRLPHFGTYFEPPAHEVGTAHEARSDPRSGPVLICAGTPYKYAPEHDAVLVDIARRLRRCQFVFFAHGHGALTRRLIERLRGAFAAHGLDASSFLLVKPWATPAAFESLLRSADLLLDTIGFSGFNTVMRALECGLPVVTCRGRFMRGRLGSGILERLSLPELVAQSPAQYADLVLSLIENPVARSRVRDELPERLPRAYRDQSAVDALERFLLEIA